MNELDYAIILVVAVSVLVGVVRGAIREVFNVAGWVMAFILAHAFAQPLSASFADWMADPVHRQVVAWVGIFLLVLVIAGLLGSLLSELVRKLGLGGLNRVAGAAIGLARGGLVLLALTLAAGLTKFPQSSLWKSAFSTPYLEVAAMHARALLPDSLASRVNFRPAELKSAAAGRQTSSRQSSRI